MTDSSVPPDKVRTAPAATSFEELQRALDPHRDEERAGVELEVAARLRSRGVDLTGNERPDEMADLLDAVDQFEAAVEAHGGDLFVDTPTTRDRAHVELPDNPAYVLPARAPDESVRSYIGRIGEAAEQMRS